MPGHRHKIVLRSDTGSLSIQVPFGARVQGRDLVPGYGNSVFRKKNKGVFTLLSSENCTRALCSGTKYQHGLYAFSGIWSR